MRPNHAQLLVCGSWRESRLTTIGFLSHGSFFPSFFADSAFLGVVRIGRSAV